MEVGDFKCDPTETLNKRTALAIYADPCFPKNRDLLKFIQGEVNELLGIELKPLTEAPDLLSSFKSKIADFDQELSGLRPLGNLAAQFCLSPLEEKLLAMVILLDDSNDVSAPARKIHCRTRNGFLSLLSRLLECARSEIVDAIAEVGTLVRTGLFSHEPRVATGMDLEDYLDCCGEGLTISLLFSDVEQRLYLAGKCQPPSKPKHLLTNFDHHSDDVRIISTLLKNACASGEEGINVLIYGPPGTGKSELGLALAAEGVFSAAYVNSEDKEKTPLSGDKRLSSYLLSQRLMLSHENPLIIFDEVEEALASNESLRSAFRTEAEASKLKAWKCRILETNPVPTIWICNGIGDIDAALLRRFSFAIQMKNPPESKRYQMLVEGIGEHGIGRKTLARAAKDERLSPADVTRTSRVLNLLGQNFSSDIASTFCKVISSRPGGVRTSKLRWLPEMPYSAAWVNTDPPAEELIERLRSAGYGRLGFFGPHGTGKTALAKHFADALQLKCEVKRASDLLDCFVGGTEQKIAAMFQDAGEDTLLLIDEVDSLLASRRDATRQWEISQVNELLTQIDEFDGYLILATNFPQHLDSALGRRLDFKVQFLPLKPDQLREAFIQTSVELGTSELSAQKALEILEEKSLELTLGDLSTAFRQASSLQNCSAAQFAAVCLSESAFRLASEPGGRRMGF